MEKKTLPEPIRMDIGVPENAGPFFRWFRGFIQGKTRITLAWIISIALALAARDQPWWPGIIVCFLGASVRFWASGHLYKDARLTVSGPYAHVRNPLYFGTWLMAVGTALAVRNPSLIAIVTAVFAVLYHFIILDEETKLEKIFGEAYLRYCSSVPRFFPRFTAASLSESLEGFDVRVDVPYNWDVARKNRWWEPHVSWVGLMGGVAFMAWVWSKI